MLRNGTVPSGGLMHDAGDYRHERISFPVVGIVVNVYASDNPINELATRTQDVRGSSIMAEVLVVNDGQDRPWRIPNVTITPPGQTGHDDFQEQVPRGISGTLSGKEYDTGLLDVNVSDLDGDFCVVGFIGGSIHQPFMMSWWPHPGNRHDPLTKDTEGRRQGRRLVRRFAGTRMAVTNRGDVVLDTNEANSAPVPGTGGSQRTQPEAGGDVVVNVKKTAELTVNFNPSVPEEALVDVLRKPGENAPGQVEREQTATQLRFTQDAIRVIAGQVMELFAYSMLHLGKAGEADENMVLGQQWKQLMTTVLDDLINHKHPTALGPSAVSVELAASFPNLLLNLDDQLSDWIFGQKFCADGALTMVMDPNVLAVELQNLTPTSDELEAAQRFADAYAVFAGDATAGAVPLSEAGRDAGKAVMTPILVGVNVPNQAATVLSAAVRGFWAAVALGVTGNPAYVSFAGATAIVPPPHVGLEQALQTVFDTNVAEPADLVTATGRVATALHTLAIVGGAATIATVQTPIL